MEKQTIRTEYDFGQIVEKPKLLSKNHQIDLKLIERKHKREVTENKSVIERNFWATKKFLERQIKAREKLTPNRITSSVNRISRRSTNFDTDYGKKIGFSSAQECKENNLNINSVSNTVENYEFLKFLPQKIEELPDKVDKIQKKLQDSLLDSQASINQTDLESDIEKKNKFEKTVSLSELRINARKKLRNFNLRAIQTRRYGIEYSTLHKNQAYIVRRAKRNSQKEEVLFDNFQEALDELLNDEKIQKIMFHADLNEQSLNLPRIFSSELCKKNDSLVMVLKRKHNNNYSRYITPESLQTPETVSNKNLDLSDQLNPSTDGIIIPEISPHPIISRGTKSVNKYDSISNCNFERKYSNSKFYKSSSNLKSLILSEKNKKKENIDFERLFQNNDTNTSTALLSPKSLFDRLKS